MSLHRDGNTLLSIRKTVVQRNFSYVSEEKLEPTRGIDSPAAHPAKPMLFLLLGSWEG